MNFWSTLIPIAIHAWVPLGLAALVPLLALVGAIPLRRRGIATVLAVRTVALLGLGFAMLAAVSTASLIGTGLRELRQRHEENVRTLAADLAHNPRGLFIADVQLRVALFRAKESTVAFTAIGTDACATTCIVSANGVARPEALTQQLKAVWPTRDGDAGAISIDGRPYLLVAEPVLDALGRPSAMVVAGVDAGYLADQAARTAWILLAIAYVLVGLVGWSSWQQLNNTLASRIDAITSQVRAGAPGEPLQALEIESHELRELAETVTSYIKTTVAAQKTSDERYRRLVELAPDAVIFCSPAGIKFVNDAAITLAGAKTRHDLIGSAIEKFLEFTPITGKHSPLSPLPALWKRPNGPVLHVEVSEISDNPAERQYVIRDVTARQLREAALTHRADHDSLTGLVNRARFESRLEEVLDPAAKSRRDDARQVAVLFIDLDGFKPVNDKYGHAAGDAVLVAVAARLRESTRETDLIARLGGDEFAVLLEVRDHDEVTAVSQRILKSLEQAIPFDGNDMSIGASIGIADTYVGTPETRSADELVRAADAAMYSAKASGGRRAAA